MDIQHKDSENTQRGNRPGRAFAWLSVLFLIGYAAVVYTLYRHDEQRHSLEVVRVISQTAPSTDSSSEPAAAAAESNAPATPTPPQN